VSLLLLTGTAHAARVGVLANTKPSVNAPAAVASDFSSRLTGHTFTPVDVSNGPPSLARLFADFDVILLFEDGYFNEAPNVGTAVYEFALAGRPVVLGTFYDQDRSDRTIGLNTANGWGLLEAIDPATTDGYGTPYQPRTLDVSSIVANHPLALNVQSLVSGSLGYAGGYQAKPGSIVIANWSTPNANGLPDPAISYRLTGARTCVIQIGIAPDYPAYGALGVDFGGDFYQVWQNAFDFGANRCGQFSSEVPVMPAAMLAVLALMLSFAAAFALPRRARRA
jgi:hypothetical protein